MSGRKNIPSLVHELRGNPGGRPIPKQIEVHGDIEDAPEWFNEEQLKAWNHVIKNAPPSLLKLCDESTLIAHCCAVAAHKEATLMLGREGYVQETLTGATKRNEWFHVQSKAAEQILKTSSEMGFTPASRSKVSASQAKSKNKFSENGNRKSA